MRKFYISHNNVKRLKKYLERKIEHNLDSIAIHRSYLNEKFIINKKFHREKIEEKIEENNMIDYMLYMINIIEQIVEEEKKEEQKRTFEQIRLIDNF